LILGEFAATRVKLSTKINAAVCKRVSKRSKERNSLGALLAAGGFFWVLSSSLIFEQRARQKKAGEE